MKNKGAIELSMSTIIVVIIGITLLSLGLIWVRGTFTKLTDLSDRAFGLSDQQINELFGDSNSLLGIIPNSVDLKQGSGVIVGVVFSNLESEDIKIKAKVTPIKTGVACVFEDTQSGSTDEYVLQSGATKKIKLIIESDKETPLGFNSCKVEIISDLKTSYSTSETVTIRIIKK